MWGLVTMCLGFVHNYTGFVVVRAVLGITEGGLLPGIVSATTPPINQILILPGIISFEYVYTWRNGSQTWFILYCSFTKWSFWWIVGKRAFFDWKARGTSTVELDLYY